MGRMKVTVTIDEAIIEDLDRLSGKVGESRSKLIEEAIRTWRRLKLERDLIEGYRAMAKEDVRVAEQNLPAGVEVLR